VAERSRSLGQVRLHDNIATSTLSLVQMRAIAGWYFTAHRDHARLLKPDVIPRTGGPPQNRISITCYFGIALVSNFAIGAMTKWGSPGVYDTSSWRGGRGLPRLVDYNHNG